MTTNNEFKARALYDFVAEGPSELSLTAGEIITITSGETGNDWWYALNASGQLGAIPATYVEIINDPIRPVSVDAESTSDNNSTYRMSLGANYQPRLEEERQQSVTSTNQRTQTPDHEYNTDSSFDSSSSRRGSQNLLETPIRSTSQTNNNNMNEFDPITSYGQTQEQHGDLTSSIPVTKSDQGYDTSSPLLVSIASNETTPVVSTSPPTKTDVLTDNTTKSNNENTASSSTTKTKTEKSKLFTLKRSKHKPDAEKRRMSTDNSLEASKDDSDSDALSDSGSPHNTLSSSNKHSSAGGDAKVLPRPKFFDKHGVGHYLLHECKTKPDEHVEIAYDESKGGVYWAPNPNVQPFNCKIENPSKETKLGGLKSFMEYKIHAEIPGSRVVGRRYKQFDWLHDQLAAKYCFICIPSLPGKQIAGRFEQEFIEERRRQLELWLNRICNHPVLCASFPVQHFITCEITEKNNKDWKAGKRKVEKDDFREASWLYCVTCPETKLSDTDLASQIDIFAQQQPGLETHLKNLNHGFNKYLERHTDTYERDVQRVGELFTKLHVVVQADAATPGNDDLANSMSKLGDSYNGIADLYKTKGYDSIRDFLERIQDYIGVLSCFPTIINIQRSATEFIRTVQQRGPSATPDLNGAIHRNQILNYVVLAEINHFQKEKVQDLKSYMKTLVDEQIQFYEKVTSELREALSTFN